MTYSRLMNKYLTLVRDLSLTQRTKVYLVGGCLRDHFLGRRAKDMDLVVMGSAFTMAKAAAAAVGGSFVPLDPVHGTARVVVNQVCLDFSDSKGPDIQADLRLRDFTVNALALDLQTEELIDPNQGVRDLKLGLLRAVYRQAFTDDPLRLLRGVRLAGQLGFVLEPATTALMHQTAGLIEQAAGERLWDELVTMLDRPTFYQSVLAMDYDLDLLKEIIPQRREMETTRQNHYHVENVWRHCLRTLKCLEALLPELCYRSPLAGHLAQPLSARCTRGQLIKLAALLHDIGKPDTAHTTPDGRITFHGHPRAGLQYTDALGRWLKLSRLERDYMNQLVLLHMAPLKCFTGKPLTDLEIYRLFKTLGAYTQDVLLLSLADLTATYTASDNLDWFDAYKKHILALFTCYYENPDKYVHPSPLLNGADLIAVGIPEGPRVKKLLDHLTEAVVLGQVTNKSEAVSYIQKLNY